MHNRPGQAHGFFRNGLGFARFMVIKKLPGSQALEFVTIVGLHVNVKAQKLSTFSQPPHCTLLSQIEAAFVECLPEQRCRIVRSPDWSNESQDRLGRIVNSQLGVIHRRPPATEGDILPAFVQEALGNPQAILHIGADHVQAPSHSTAQPKPGNACQRQTKSRPARSRCNPFLPIIRRNATSLSAI